MDPLQAALLFGRRDLFTNGAPGPRPRRTRRTLAPLRASSPGLRTRRRHARVAAIGRRRRQRWSSGQDEPRSNSPNSSMRPRSSIVATVRLSISAIHRWPRSLVRSSVPAITTAMIHT